MLYTFLILALAAAAGGAINSIAGGGTLLTFPTLAATLGGDDQALKMANITSTLALFPGSLAAVWGYRRELEGNGAWIKLLIGPSLIGGIVGSLLLVLLPDKIFGQLVPWLVLLAAVLFAAQPQIARWTGIGKEQAAPTRNMAIGVFVFQFLVAVYGGYFGAGIGILMLSSLAMMGLGDIHRMNALKTLLASSINGTSVAIFLWIDFSANSLHKVIHWPYAAVMIAASIAGGYGGARVAQRMNKNVVRWIVVTIGFALAGYYFYDKFVK